MKKTMMMLVLLLTGGMSVAWANLVENNSFENPIVSGVVYNAGANWLNGGNLIDWTGSMVNYGNGNNWFAYGTFSVASQDGNQMVSMQNYALWQNTGIQMRAGDSYTLSGYARYATSNSGSAHFALFAMNQPVVDLAGWLAQLTEAVYSGTMPASTWSSTPNVTVSYTCTSEYAGKYLVVAISESSPLVNGINTGAAVFLDNINLTCPPATSSPVFNYGGKYVSGPTAIAITSATPGANIYYTIDNTTPTTSSSLYTGPVTVYGGTVLKAMALASGYNTSDVTSMTYVYCRAKNPSFENPIVTGVVYNSDADWLNGGNLTDWTGGLMNYGNGNNWFAYGRFSTAAQDDSQMVSMQNYGLSQNTGIQMELGKTYTFSGYARYTTSNSGMTLFRLLSTASNTGIGDDVIVMNSTIYPGTSPLTQWPSSPNVTVSYTCTDFEAGKYLVLDIKETSPLVNGVNMGAAVFLDGINLACTQAASAPTFNPGGKYISGPTAITITSATPEVSIYYTIDNSTPTTSSTLYSGPVTVYGGTVLKAIAVANGYANSAVTSLTFIYNPAMAQLTRGYYLLIEKGLQIQALTLPDVYGHLMASMSRFEESNFTGLSYGYDFMSPSWYSVPGPQWVRWSRGEGLQDFELPYLSQMVSFQYRDENNITDSAIVQKMKKWYAQNRLRYPDIINHDDQAPIYSFDVNKAYVAEAKPDMVMLQNYPFQSVMAGGSPTTLYGRLQMYRQVAMAGLDGNGNYPIPYGRYIQAWPDNCHTPSESEIRLDQFSSWAFGYKFVEAFLYTKAPAPVYPDNLNSILFTGLGDSNPTVKFTEFAETNRQSRNLGPALVRLFSTDVRMKMGRHHGPRTHWYQIGVGPWEEDNTLPSGVSAWSTSADIYMTGVSATNPGNCNTYIKDDLFSSWTVRLPGDVLIGFFKPLHEDFDGSSYSNQKYFMVVNGLTDSIGNAAACHQQIRIDFDFGTSGINSLQRLRRSDGQMEVIPLTSDGGSKYHVILELDGGTGDLFKYNTGAPFVGITN